MTWREITWGSKRVGSRIKIQAPFPLQPKEIAPYYTVDRLSITDSDNTVRLLRRLSKPRNSKRPHVCQQKGRKRLSNGFCPEGGWWAVAPCAKLVGVHPWLRAGHCRVVGSQTNDSALISAVQWYLVRLRPGLGGSSRFGIRVRKDCANVQMKGRGGRKKTRRSWLANFLFSISLGKLLLITSNMSDVDKKGGDAPRVREKRGLCREALLTVQERVCSRQTSTMIPPDKQVTTMNL